jgi:protein-tyrosine phosphatase
MIDSHCHILPGVDDGPGTLEDALAMARLAVADGVRTIVATPHLGPVDYAHHPWIAAGVTGLNAALQEAGVPLEILPGAEIAATLELLPHLAALPRLGDGPYLLLEPPLTGLATFLEELVFGVQLAGGKVVLAHPERTQMIQFMPDVFWRLAERGCVLQLNVASLVGTLGGPIRRVALKLLRECPECVVASDAHNAVQRPPLLRKAAPAFRRLGGAARWREVTEERPGRMVGR